MESTLLTGDYVYIALIVIIFASGVSTSSVVKRLDKIEERLKEYRTPSHIAALMNHVTDQVKPEQREDFQEEFQVLLKRYVTNYDDKYVWK